MSRLRRLKERKSKNRIRVASCGLLLALAVGSVQGLGTYTLFTDSKDVSSELAISTGDVDVEINSNFFEHTNVQPNEEYRQTFNITNKGTLRQNINLSLTPNGTTDLYKYIESYKIDFGVIETPTIIQELSEGTIVINTNLDKINMKTSTMNEVGQNIVDISNLKLTGSENLNQSNGELFILNPGETITFNTTVKISDMTAEEQDLFYNQSLDLNLNIESIQLGDKNIANKGFFDIEVKKDRFTIGKKNIIDSEKNEIVVNRYGDGDETIRIDFSALKDIGVTNNISLVEDNGVIQSGGVFDGIKNEAVGYQNRNYFYINEDIYENKNGWKLSEKFDNGNYVKIKFVYPDVTKEVKFDFRRIGEGASTGNKRLQSMYTIEKIYDTVKEQIGELPQDENEIVIPEVVESPNEEVEKPSEPDVVEPPKEEIEVPTDPEVIEPAKEEVEIPSEPEVVEPPKEEIIEIPKQPESIAPSN